MWGQLAAVPKTLTSKLTLKTVASNARCRLGLI